jgi:DNA-binding protein H-NS
MNEIESMLAERAALDQKIEAARRQKRADTIAQIKALMAEYGLTLADLGSRGAAAPRKPARKVPPKYRHPGTGETWSGRGLQPNWLKSALAGGAQISDFKV